MFGKKSSKSTRKKLQTLDKKDRRIKVLIRYITATTLKSFIREDEKPNNYLFEAGFVNFSLKLAFFT